MEDVPLLQTRTAFAAGATLDAPPMPVDAASDPASPDHDLHPVMGICAAAVFGLLCWIVIARMIF
jgi:hypothetical protein